MAWWVQTRLVWTPKLYIYQQVQEKKGGGVSLYIADYLTFKCRHDLEYFDSEMESLFIKIEG